jgi:hypothetical protein
MADQTPCQRPDCDQPAKPRSMTVPASGKKVTLSLCDEDYADAVAKDELPRWLSELMTHIGLVG